MTKKEFYFSSADENVRMHAVEWIPQGEPKAVLYLLPGMVEQVCRYEALADFFTGQGFVVVQGACHGNCFSEQKTKEMQACLSEIKRKYPDVPYLLMGIAEGVPAVCSFVTTYPGAAEGIVLAEAEQENVQLGKDLPVLLVSDMENDRQDVFQHIYQWAEERLDEMLYRAAIKQ